MLQLERISLTSPIFQKNISALKERQPELAERLRSVKIPESMQMGIGRDGWPVVVQSISDDHIGWMGGSSMPTVSAPAALTNFVDQGVNVALPSIGTGYECLYLIQRLQPHCAVFVCEESTERVAATLDVVDLSEPINAGRLVLLDGDVAITLPEFIDTHPGYDFPTQLIALAEFDAAQFKARTNAVHHACHIASDVHAKKVNALRHRAQPTRPATNDKPHVAVLSVDAVGGSIEHARRIERAAHALSWTTSISVPDHPQSCSQVSRVRAVADTPVDFVLILNGTPGRLAEYISPDVPVASWFLDGFALPPVAFEGVSEVSNLAAASGQVQQMLIARGGRRDCIRIVEKGVDDGLFRGAPDAALRTDSILVMVDGENLSPQAANIGLESHEKLWAEMQQSIAQVADRKKPIDVPELLKKAERSTGVKFSDDDLRRQFLAIVTERMPRTIVTRSAVEAIASAGLRVDLFGRNWSSHESAASCYRGAIPADRDRARQMSQAPCMVIPFVDAAAVQSCLEAIVAGCLPLMREDHGDFLSHYPSARQVLSKVPSYGTHTELLALIRKWNSPGDEREQLVESLRSELLVSQRTADRLKDILHFIRA
ncbi:MAG: hypothetical protein KDA54_00435 [Phycisphaerales bacterium]|nr:hypothetical protein [Phycisphaerales bacterium]